jgi:hypothetical protein
LIGSFSTYRVLLQQRIRASSPVVNFPRSRSPLELSSSLGFCSHSGSRHA